MGCEQSRTFKKFLNVKDPVGAKRIPPAMKSLTHNVSECTTVVFEKADSFRRVPNGVVPELMFPDYKFLHRQIGITRDAYNALELKWQSLGQFNYKTDSVEKLKTDCDVNLLGVKLWHIGQFKRGTKTKHGLGF